MKYFLFVDRSGYHGKYVWCKKGENFEAVINDLAHDEIGIYITKEEFEFLSKLGKMNNSHGWITIV